MDFEIALTILSYISRFIGLTVFGVALGWFTLFAFRALAENWQLKVAVFLGFLALVAVVVRFETAGSEGGFALGAGIALLIWGLRGSGKKEEEPEEKSKKK